MIGIDISDRSIKLVQLANDKSHRLLSYCSTTLPNAIMKNGLIIDVAAVQEQIHLAFKQCRLSARVDDAVVVSIPETQSFLRVVEIPAMADDEINEAVRWEVAQHIPFGLETVYIDWQDLKSGGHRAKSGRREVQVGAAQRKVIDLLYETLSTLQLDIAAFELESQAIVRSLISAELRDRQGLLVVDVGASATNVVVHDHGAMRFTATLKKGIVNLAQTIDSQDGSIAVGRLHQLEREELARLGTKLFPAMEELAMEIRGIAEFYNSIDATHEVKEIIITGGGANLPGLDTALIKHFDNVHVQRGNPWVNILTGKAAARPPLDVKESVRFTTALGLALRPVIL